MLGCTTGEPVSRGRVKILPHVTKTLPLGVGMTGHHYTPKRGIVAHSVRGDGVGKRTHALTDSEGGEMSTKPI